MESVELALTVVGTSVVTVISLYKFYFKKVLESEITERVEKQLTKHRLELGHKYNREMADYSLYANKKHLVYGEINKLILDAESKVSRLYGIQYKPILNELSEFELSEYLRNLGLLNSFTQSFLDKWDNQSEEHDQKKIAQDLQSYLLDKGEFNIAMKSLSDLQDYFWKTLIYFSPELEKDMKELLKNLLDLFRIHTKRIRSVEDIDLSGKLENKVPKQIEICVQTMRKELSNGFYKNS